MTYVFLFISMLMLVIPVVPHHHHADSLICMKSDLGSDGCAQDSKAGSEHCCCDTGCVTTHFFQQAPHSDDAWSHPDATWVAILFSDSLFKLLVLPESNIKRSNCTYIESLHGTFIACATGLRAPPCA